MSNPEMNVHVDGTPDVPDIVRPGDWLALEDYNGFESFVLVVKVFKTYQGELDYCPGAESWSIQYLGISYLRKEENLSSHDCGWINGIVAVNGELLELYKLGWNEEDKRRVVPNPGYTVTRSAESLIKRMNAAEQSMHLTASGVGGRGVYPLQLSFFAEGTYRYRDPFADAPEIGKLLDEHGYLSVSLVQRKLRMVYTSAVRWLDFFVEIGELELNEKTHRYTSRRTKHAP